MLGLDSSQAGDKSVDAAAEPLRLSELAPSPTAGRGGVAAAANGGTRWGLGPQLPFSAEAEAEAQGFPPPHPRGREARDASGPATYASGSPREGAGTRTPTVGAHVRMCVSVRPCACVPGRTWVRTYAYVRGRARV